MRLVLYFWKSTQSNFFNETTQLWLLLLSLSNSNDQWQLLLLLPRYSCDVQVSENIWHYQVHQQKKGKIQYMPIYSAKYYYFALTKYHYRIIICYTCISIAQKYKIERDGMKILFFWSDLTFWGGAAVGGTKHCVDVCHMWWYCVHGGLWGMKLKIHETS